MKTRVSTAEYIELLNRELERHPGYEVGMKFVPVLAGADASQVTGYRMENLNGRKAVFREVAWKIHALYEAEP